MSPHPPTALSEPIFAVDKLVARYGERTILREISFAAQRQEILVILGGSGSGKSTLLKHMLRLREPVGGQVWLAGKELTALAEAPLEASRLQVGFLFQNGALLGSLTVAENVAMPLEMHRRLPPAVVAKLVQRGLAQVGLACAGDQLPDQLSGGMRKRAALARALILEPALLVCDEPSAGLDPVTARQLDELLLSLRANLGTTLIVVTHEVESIRRIADRVLFLAHGRVLLDGSLEEAEASPLPAVQAFFS